MRKGVKHEPSGESLFQRSKLGERIVFNAPFQWKSQTGKKRQAYADRQSVNIGKFRATLVVCSWTAGHGGILNHKAHTHTYTHTLPCTHTF